MSEQDKMNIIYHVFIQWLFKKNLLNTWMNNVIEQNDIYRDMPWMEVYSGTKTNQETVCNVISIAMTWASTSQGDAFWLSLHNEWARTCHELYSDLYDK